MIVNKIILTGGQLADQKALHSDDLNPQLLRAAQDILSALQMGSASVTTLLSDGSEVTVALGLPHLKKYFERWTGEDGQAKPEADLSKHEALRRQVDEYNRRTVFSLTYGKTTQHYVLVPLDCSEEEEAGLYGTVAGSMPRDLMFVMQASEAEKEQHNQDIRAVVRKIVSLKPAFLSSAMRTDPLSLFSDYFAVAMLLPEQDSNK